MYIGLCGCDNCKSLMEVSKRIAESAQPKPERIVRCNHHETCGGTDREDANNWCDHWGEHKVGDTENGCSGLNFCRDAKGLEIKVECIMVEKEIKA